MLGKDLAAGSFERVNKPLSSINGISDLVAEC